ncbi:MAG: heme lyase CcmF/NrfE family subunit [Anaerolineales bacterium]|nr:heme lyase CcmF/NrfE family subunit [Anaerolineales bacterium]
MFADLGHAALWISLGAAVYALAAAIYGGVTKNDRWVDSARHAVVVIFFLLVGTAVILVAALLNNDFSIDYVYQVTSRATPVALIIAARCGGQAGSLLLWNVMLAAFMALAVTSKRNEKELMPWFIVVGTMTQIFFLFITAGPEDPFARLPVVPPDGTGLSPLLRHPLMIIHPPMLYLGYTGFVVPYAFAMAAMMAGRLDDAWIRITRRWTLAAWLFLSLGLVLGGRWAYDVLGWGGYWAWDPVENAAFMPWLAGTAFLHSVMIQEKRGMFKVWNVILVLLTYLLIVYGTLIVRTGLLSSVHAFAQSDIQWHFFWFTTIMVLFSAFWVTYRYKALQSHNYLNSLLSREAAFLLNNFVIIALLLVIFLFTNWTLLSEFFTGQQYGIGEMTYELATAPLFGVLLLLMGIAPLTAWYRTSAKRLGRLMIWPAVVATLFIVVLAVAFGVVSWGALLGMWIVAFSLTTTVLEYVRGARARMKRGENVAIATGKLFQRNQRRYGGYLIHLGVLVMAFGIIGTEFFQQETQINLRVGERATLSNYEIEFQGATFGRDNDVTIARATVDVYRNGEFLLTLQPHTDIYDSGEGMTIPDAYSTLVEDFYLILVNWEGISADSATIRMYLNPLINWVWLGGLVFMAGTFIAAWPDPLDEKIVLAAQRRVSLVGGD